MCSFGTYDTEAHVEVRNCHKVYRVPGFLSSLQNWLPPPPHPQASVAPLWFQGGTHSLAGERVGGANSDEGTDNLVLQLQYNLSKNRMEFQARRIRGYKRIRGRVFTKVAFGILRKPKFIRKWFKFREIQSIFSQDQAFFNGMASSDSYLRLY